MLTLQCKKGDDNDVTTDAVSSYSWAIPPWSIVGQRGWLEGLHADTRGAAPFFLETPASSVFSVVFSSTGCQNGKEGRSADHRVLGRGQHSLNRTVHWSQRGRGHKWWDRGNEKADGTRGSPPWRGKPRERAPCAGLHARADLCYLHRSPPGGASAIRLALDADRSNRARIRRGLEGLGDAKQSLVVTGLGRRGRCGEKTPEWLPG